MPLPAPQPPPSPPSGFQNQMLIGFAEFLQSAGIANYVTSGIYTPNQIGITLRVMPSAPDAIVMLSTYSVTDDPSLSDSVLGLQVQVRMDGEDPRPTNDLADSVFNVLHGLHDVDLATSVHVVQCLRRSGVSLGLDELRRWMWSDNYYVTTWRPSPNRL